MNTLELAANIRNILLLQMVVMTLYQGFYHGKVLSGRLGFLSIWQSLRKPLLPGISKEAKKGNNSFREIDMSKL